MSHSLSKMWLHIIFSTKDRHPFLNEKIRSSAYAYMAGTLKKLGVLVEIIGGVEDHVHILCCLPRTMTLAKLMEKVKTSSSQVIKEKGVGNFHWQNGYGCFSVSQSEVETVVRYIKNQKEHHKKMTFQEEYVKFLKKHKIDYDKKYIFG